MCSSLTSAADLVSGPFLTNRPLQHCCGSVREVGCPWEERLQHAMPRSGPGDRELGSSLISGIMFAAASWRPP